MDWYINVLKQYAVFDGRSRRQEYWMFFLINAGVTLGLSVIEGVIGLQGYISGLYGLAVFLPSLGVAIRRLHDIGRTGWWVLICFVPLIGLIVLLIFLIQDSQPGSNEYGPNPKGA